MERHDLRIGGAQALWNELCGAFEHDAFAVERQAVKARAVFGGEGFQAIECAFFFEGFCVAFDGVRGIEDAGAAAGGFFGADGVRGRIGAEEKLWGAGDGGAA